MSRNKFNRSMDGSRAEAVKIYNQRKQINAQQKIIDGQKEEIARYKSILDDIYAELCKLDYDKYVYSKKALEDNRLTLLKILNK